jgi:hypothetical protein
MQTIRFNLRTVIEREVVMAVPASVQVVREHGIDYIRDSKDGHLCSPTVAITRGLLDGATIIAQGPER